MEAKIGIAKKDQTEISDVLNVLLADQHILYIKLRNYHWNVEGPSFLELHSFLEKLYTTLAAQIDSTAERIRKIGKSPMGSCEEFLQFTNLNETRQPYHDPVKILSTLLSDYETVIRWIRDHIESVSELKDYGTEEAAWMLRAYISKK